MLMPINVAKAISRGRKASVMESTFRKNPGNVSFESKVLWWQSNNTKCVDHLSEMGYIGLRIY